MISVGFASLSLSKISKHNIQTNISINLTKYRKAKAN